MDTRLSFRRWLNEEAVDKAAAVRASGLKAVEEYKALGARFMDIYEFVDSCKGQPYRGYVLLGLASGGMNLRAIEQLSGAKHYQEVYTGDLGTMSPDTNDFMNKVVDKYGGRFICLVPNDIYGEGIIKGSPSFTTRELMWLGKNKPYARNAVFVFGSYDITSAEERKRFKPSPMHPERVSQFADYLGNWRQNQSGNTAPHASISPAAEVEPTEDYVRRPAPGQ